MPAAGRDRARDDAAREEGGFAEALGHRFRDRSLLALALTHPSAPMAGNYQRLEFLGDRVLGLVIAEWLFQSMPEATEGELAPRFTALVRREALAEVAERIGLADELALARGEEDSGGRRKPAILADACEAVIAALYIDAGLETAQRFIRRHWQPLVARSEAMPRDAKTRLQEWAQARSKPAPDYREVGRTGPAHAPRFRVEAVVAGLGSAHGEGSTKRQAEQMAARELLALAGEEDEKA